MATKTKKPETPKAVKVEGAQDPVQLVLETIKKMNLLQVQALVKAMETEFGISAAPLVAAGPSMAAAAAPAAAAAAPAVEEQTEFDVILKEVGAQKIQVIKVIRELTSLGLKESKELVEGAPSPIKQGVGKDEANNIKAKVEEVGGKAEIK